MSKTIGSFEAKSKLSEFLRYVHRTKSEIVITVRGKEMAKLTPVETSPELEKTREAILHFRKGKKLGGDLKKLISHGRK